MFRFSPYALPLQKSQKGASESTKEIATLNNAKNEVTLSSSPFPVKSSLHNMKFLTGCLGGAERIHAQRTSFRRLGCGGKMKIAKRIKEAAATGYILLWLLGIPIPILLIIFLLRGCT